MYTNLANIYSIATRLYVCDHRTYRHQARLFKSDAFSKSANSWYLPKKFVLSKFEVPTTQSHIPYSVSMISNCPLLKQNLSFWPQVFCQQNSSPNPFNCYELAVLNCVRVLAGYSHAETVFNTADFIESEFLKQYEISGNISMTHNWYENLYLLLL